MIAKKELCAMARQAKAASYQLMKVSSDIKDRSLLEMASSIKQHASTILKANKRDIALLRKRKNISQAFVDRLRLNEERIGAMVQAVRDVAGARDPIGEVKRMWKRPNGLQIGKITVPIGVICIIYESRPNVTSDCAALTLKSSNAVILRGGSEALYSNSALYTAMKKGLKRAGELPEGTVNFIDTADREAVGYLLTLDEFIDAVIPRGGEGLIKAVAEQSRIPVIKHYKGVCHLYVDRFADCDMAEKICINAKVERPGVCNAIETLLVHKDKASIFLPRVIHALKRKKVEIRGCEKTRAIVSKGVKKATEEDWFTEYLDLILSVRVVNSSEAAITHINRYGSHHSDAIVTENIHEAMRFLQEVDSAAVYVNASTRFTDGGQFGLGAEIGISTDKLHARGPVGVDELTTYKYIVFGSGQIRT
ncbi:MAG: glutamate-5-semialdehyde dehydrogenase [Candidatus Omnitrophica bacterium]|nr:glutamate-5-semialdehyde dehydrogenase [Candidatus Omnitrophota bacterium]